MHLAPVPRVRAIGFRPRRWPGEPCVVLENARGWRALERWNADYLQSVAGPREIPVREVSGPPRNVFQNLAEGGRVRFAEYLEWVLATAAELRDVTAEAHAAGAAAAFLRREWEVSYYLDVKLRQLSEELLQDVAVPAWYGEAPIDINFWCGVGGTSSGLHCDVTPNCNVQVVGRKHFTLFPPAQSRAVYRIPSVTHCRFDPDQPDFDRFPLARDAAGLECTLAPGESLYIPVGWYHQVTVVSGWAVNVNFFWRRPFPQGLSNPSLWRFLLRRRWAQARQHLRRARLGDRRPVEG